MTDTRLLGYKPRAKSRLGWLLPLWGLAIVVPVGGAGWLYHLQQQHEQQQVQQIRALQEQLGRLAQGQRQLGDDYAASQHQWQALREQVQHSHDAETLGQHRQRLVAEVGFYLDLAEQHLQERRDAQLAQQLLEQGIRLLANANDSNLLPLQQALTNERLTLLAAQQVDKTGLSLRINALKERTLQLVWPVPARTPVPTTAASAGAASAWERGWQAFRALVVIRHYDQPVRPLLADDQRWLLQQNVYLELTRAQLALDNSRQSAWQQALHNALNLLQTHAPTGEQYAAMSVELRELAAVPLPEVPLTLTQARGALNAWLQLQSVPEAVMPAVAESVAVPVPAPVAQEPRP